MSNTREEQCAADQREHGDKPCRACRTCCLHYRDQESKAWAKVAELERDGPRVRAPLAIYGDTALSNGARITLLLLWQCAWHRQLSGNWLARVSKAELLRLIGRPRSTLNRHIRALMRSNWVVAVSRFDASKSLQFELAEPVEGAHGESR